ncbi:IclR family transcriptional regulator [Antarctobacter heliothermus]|uniref:Transcriptional regulator, IclR family n=1 Tax=Antarctobacter heliothermus TaxID=74033 RepID=A0A239M2I6_9RHOB|nr:helix-turn-helix domain-containing protein [Antarctobacter heliothermus]SNT36119.1 transcriptional regulator, IclR family [Antarctobacter heliothermus]
MTKTEGKLQKYSAPALEKGLDILEFLSLTDFRPTLSEVASGIDRSKSEIFRMMIVLEERGYIQRLDGDSYSLTDRMSVLGAPRSFNGRLAEIASPYLKQLSDETGLSNHLCVLDDNQVLVIANSDAANNYGLSLQVGFRTELAGSGTAACLLFDRSDSENLGLNPREWEDLGGLLKGFDTNGYVQSRNPEINSVLELSAPVGIGVPLRPVAAITLALLDSTALRNTIPDIADHLKSAVSALGQKIDISMPSLAQKVVSSGY